MSVRAPVRRLAASNTTRLFSRGVRGVERRPHICPACLHRLQYAQSSKPLPRRTLATAAAERPQTFHPEPPPRNAAVPDTSITNNTAADAREREAQAASNSPNPQQNVEGPASQREGEAQKSQDVNGASIAKGSIASETSSTSSTKPARKSKLRPRKAAMSLTPKAVSQLKDLLEQPDPKLIRVGVKNRGCSGLAYHLEYVDKAGRFDEAVEQDGVKVLVDSKALFSIIGSEMDWQEDKLSARFVFRNPNITEQCGCGESFSTG